MEFKFSEEDIEQIVHLYLQDTLNLLVVGKPKFKTDKRVIEAKAKPTAKGWNKKEGHDG